MLSAFPSIPSFISLRPLFIGFRVFRLSVIADPTRWRKGANGGFFRWASGLRVPSGECCLAQLRIDSREKPVLELEKIDPANAGPGPGTTEGDSRTACGGNARWQTLCCGSR